MRIIGGSLSGLTFNTPKSQTVHPMGEKVRGATFNILGDMEGLSVLDAFAGSGALSFESVSRGALRVTAVESNKNCQVSIASSIDSLGVNTAVKLIRASLGSWLLTDTGTTFDIIFCDPPYDKLNLQLLDKVAGKLSSKGTLVLSWPGKEPVPDFSGFSIVKNNLYGDAQLVFYQRIP